MIRLRTEDVARLDRLAEDQRIETRGAAVAWLLDREETDMAKRTGPRPVEIGPSTDATPHDPDVWRSALDALDTAREQIRECIVHARSRPGQTHDSAAEALAGSVEAVGRAAAGVVKAQGERRQVRLYGGSLLDRPFQEGVDGDRSGAVCSGIRNLRCRRRVACRRTADDDRHGPPDGSPALPGFRLYVLDPTREREPGSCVGLSFVLIYDYGFGFQGCGGCGGFGSGGGGAGRGGFGGNFTCRRLVAAIFFSSCLPG